MARLSGKTALITAAGQGIGRACAELFSREGAGVIAADINQAALANLEGCRTCRLDVTDKAAIDKLAAQLGSVNILFNCAGFVANGPVLDCDETDWDYSFDLNVKSMYRMIKAFLPALLAAGAGSIINMASVAGSLPTSTVYFAKWLIILRTSLPVGTTIAWDSMCFGRNYLSSYGVLEWVSPITL